MSVARWWSALSPVKSPRKHRRRVRPWPSLYGQIQELETRALLTPGALDTTFGGGGSLITTFTTGDDVGKGVAIQSDGKIVVVGTCPGVTNNPSSSTDFALVRYNTDGSLDTTFGNGGKVRTNVFQFDNAFGVTVQPDGKIIVVGETFTGSNFDFAVLRYNANGSLDGTWGFAGIVTTDFGFGDDGAQGTRPGQPFLRVSAR